MRRRGDLFGKSISFPFRSVAGHTHPELGLNCTPALAARTTTAACARGLALNCSILGSGWRVTRGGKRMTTRPPSPALTSECVEPHFFCDRSHSFAPHLSQAWAKILAHCALLDVRVSPPA